MGRFALDAPWIRRIFPPSGAPATRQPFAVSDDIQLTQDFLAYGQTQESRPYLRNTSILNPGQQAFRALVNPIEQPISRNEVWRVFFVTIELPSTAANFDFRICLRHVQSSQLCFVSERQRIIGAIAQPVVVWPVMTTATNGTAPADANYQSNPVPLLLPVDEEATTNGNVITLDIFQTSTQAINTETIDVQFYVLRNPRGLAHVL